MPRKEEPQPGGRIGGNVQPRAERDLPGGAVEPEPAPEPPAPAVNTPAPASSPGSSPAPAGHDGSASMEDMLRMILPSSPQQSPEQQQITARVVNKSTLGLRVPKELNDQFQQATKLIQGYLNLPNGVLPEIAGHILLENLPEIARRADEWKRQQDQ